MEERRKSSYIDEDTKDKIQAIHDAMIRLEPVCEDVKKIKKWKEGNGIPGAQFQLWVLWGLFLIISARILAAQW